MGVIPALPASESVWKEHILRSDVPDSLPPHGLWATRLLSPWGSPGKNAGVGCRFLLWGIFPPRDQAHVTCIARVTRACRLGLFPLDCLVEFTREAI